MYRKHITAALSQDAEIHGVEKRKHLPRLAVPIHKGEKEGKALGGERVES